ncbi:hypothetical protein [Paenibacillus tianmuensis]|uniref:hypothetical protein n=1 Tax=Paenibacillus tianmuensis TaxID=624147 RepID=UPI001C258307|nr:hypothetical protein [Paenibacillus tianmuensis]
MVDGLQPAEKLTNAAAKIKVTILGILALSGGLAVLFGSTSLMLISRPPIFDPNLSGNKKMPWNRSVIVHFCSHGTVALFIHLYKMILKPTA